MDVYPLLKPHDWPHRELVAHRPITDQVPGVPIVAFGYNADRTYRFVPRDECPDAGAMYAEALANLAKLDYPWELGDVQGLRFATSSGNDFSAEKVLDPVAMRACHDLLEADRIFVTAPRRTCLMATRDGLPDEEMDLFVRLTLRTYNDASYGHAPISPALFILEDGVTRGVAFAE
ncbi:MAG: hypothetical protein J0I06_15980 [Planctomycetes bacterium]|nr:hypothetical protein [Planctomycetota bacterium]